MMHYEAEFTVSSCRGEMQAWRYLWDQDREPWRVRADMEQIALSTAVEYNDTVAAVNLVDFQYREIDSTPCPCCASDESDSAA